MARYTSVTGTMVPRCVPPRSCVEGCWLGFITMKKVIRAPLKPVWHHTYTQVVDLVLAVKLTRSRFALKTLRLNRKSSTHIASSATTKLVSSSYPPNLLTHTLRYSERFDYFAVGCIQIDAIGLQCRPGLHSDTVESGERQN